MRGDDPDKNAARLTVELEAAALRAVCRTYDGLNAAHFRRALQRPVMDWTDGGQRWEPGTRASVSSD